MAPKFNENFICLVNWERQDLAGLVLSHIHIPKHYSLIFEFPEVTTAEDNFDEDKQDEHYISRTRSRDFNIHIINIIKRVPDCKKLILAGISPEQLSYFTFLDDFNIIQIDDYDDIDNYLLPITGREQTYTTTAVDMCKNLPYALYNGLALSIGEENEKQKEFDQPGNGIVVVEDDGKTSTIIGISYAASIEQNIEIIEPTILSKYEIQSLLLEWKEGNDNAFNDLSHSIYGRIEHLDFSDKEFATFFTKGSPYSLILKNEIPITHVHLNYHPDFFVFNNIYFNSKSETFSSVVFSPKEFEDEETDFVIKTLEDNNIFVKSLVGENASVYNIDNYVKHFPFSLIHFCSHGGEVEGSRITEVLTDSHGNKHTVTYDEVVSIGPSKYDKLVPVLVKRYWREFDGFKWKSKELKAQNIPSSVYAEMSNIVGENKDLDRSNRVIVPDSSHIKCSSFIYQAVFRHLAASHSPFVFNNTCSSWSDIADSFLGSGAKGYLGTLWNIDNQVAKNAADIFYAELFKGTFLSAFFKSLEATKGTSDENIYIFWGLHFSSMKPSISKQHSRNVVLRKLKSSLTSWKRLLLKTTNTRRREDIKRFIEWNARCQTEHFRPELLAYLVHRMRRRQ